MVTCTQMHQYLRSTITNATDHWAAVDRHPRRLLAWEVGALVDAVQSARAACFSLRRSGGIGMPLGKVEHYLDAAVRYSLAWAAAGPSAMELLPWVRGCLWQAAAELTG